MSVKYTVSVMLSAIVLLAVACSKKDHGVITRPTIPATDQQTVRLKEMVVQNEPTPHFAFTYNDSAYVSTISFAANLFTYRYFYKDRRIDSVSTSSTDGTYLLYRYEGELVTSIEQYDRDGLAMIVAIGYDKRNRVTNIEWKPLTSGIPKTTTFEYYGNGNLYAMKTVYPASKTISLVSFEAYDDQKNVEGFAVFKDFFDHMTFLPAVKFQYNNPTKVSIIRGNNRIELQHEYTYKDSLPVQQKTTAQITDGSGKAQTLTGLTTYTYFE